MIDGTLAYAAPNRFMWPNEENSRCGQETSEGVRDS